MMMIILGRNRAELSTIKAADYDKHFFQERKQAYRMFPDGFTRMRIYKDGIEQESEEVYVYAENGIVPRVTHGLDYSAEAIMSDIDFHKNATTAGFINRFKIFVDSGLKLGKLIYPFAGAIIAGLIVLWAFVH